MIQLHIVDDTNIKVPTVKLICQCGWVEKAYADRHAVEIAEQHIRFKHREVGLIQYNNRVYKVS